MLPFAEAFGHRGVAGREVPEGHAGLLQGVRVARAGRLVRRRDQGRGRAGLHQRRLAILGRLQETIRLVPHGNTAQCDCNRLWLIKWNGSVAFIQRQTRKAIGFRKFRQGLMRIKIIGDPIFKSQSVLISRNDIEDQNAVDVFVRRLQGVIVARAYVLVDYDIPNTLIDKACVITPGIESPTVSSLHDSAWSAVRAMVPRKQVHAVMDELYDLGARGVIVTDIHACRI